MGIGVGLTSFPMANGLRIMTDRATHRLIRTTNGLKYQPHYLPKGQQTQALSELVLNGATCANSKKQLLCG